MQLTKVSNLIQEAAQQHEQYSHGYYVLKKIANRIEKDIGKLKKESKELARLGFSTKYINFYIRTRQDELQERRNRSLHFKQLKNEVHCKLFELNLLVKGSKYEV